MSAPIGRFTPTQGQSEQPPGGSAQGPGEVMNMVNRQHRELQFESPQLAASVGSGSARPSGVPLGKGGVGNGKGPGPGDKAAPYAASGAGGFPYPINTVVDGQPVSPEDMAYHEEKRQQLVHQMATTKYLKKEAPAEPFLLIEPGLRKLNLQQQPLAATRKIIKLHTQLEETGMKRLRKEANEPEEDRRPVETRILDEDLWFKHLGSMNGIEHTDEEGFKYRCKMCDKKFATFSDMLLHTFTMPHVLRRGGQTMMPLPEAELVRLGSGAVETWRVPVSKAKAEMQKFARQVTNQSIPEAGKDNSTSNLVRVTSAGGAKSPSRTPPPVPAGASIERLLPASGNLETPPGSDAEGGGSGNDRRASICLSEEAFNDHPPICLSEEDLDPGGESESSAESQPFDQLDAGADGDSEGE